MTDAPTPEGLDVEAFEKFHTLKKMWRSGEGAALLIALIVCAVGAPFIAPLLPIENAMGAVGAIFVYVMTFIVIAGLLRNFVFRGFIMARDRMGQKTAD
jgi:membrane protease YdiL (CAAX protease family)